MKTKWLGTKYNNLMLTVSVKCPRHYALGGGAERRPFLTGTYNSAWDITVTYHDIYIYLWYVTHVYTSIKRVHVAIVNAM